MRRNYTIYLTLLTICFSIGISVLLIGHLIPPLKQLDSKLFSASVQLSESEFILSEYNGTDLRRDILTKNGDQLEVALVDVVNLDLSNQDSVFNNPPLASDIAAICENVRTYGADHIHLTTQFHQDTKEPYLKHLIQQVLSEKNKEPFIKRFTIPLQLGLNVTEKPSPAYLKTSTITTKQAKGNLNLLPKVNSVIHSPIDKVNFSSLLEIPKSVRFGFSEITVIEDVPDKTPLLAKWGDRILFHHSLLTFMSLNNVILDDIKIRLGKDISLGKNKPSIPIDSFGYINKQTFTKDELLNSYKVYNTTELINKEQTPLKRHVIITASATNDTAFQLVSDPLDAIHQFSLTPNYKIAKSYLRLPIWLEAFVLIEFILIIAFLYRFRGINLHLCYLLLIIVVWLLSQLFTQTTGYWYPYSPVIILIIQAWITTTFSSSKWKLRKSSNKLTKTAKNTVIESIESVEPTS